MKQDISAVFSVLFVIVAIVMSVVKTAKKNVGNGQQKPPAQQPPRRPSETLKARREPEKRPVTKPQTAKPAAAAAPVSSLAGYMPIQPTLAAEHDHDHAGSLGDLHTEGYDPCHDEQLGEAADPALAAPVPAMPTNSPRLAFSWSGDEMVRGFVMGEILNRKR